MATVPPVWGLFSRRRPMIWKGKIELKNFLRGPLPGWRLSPMAKAGQAQTEPPNYLLP